MTPPTMTPDDLTRLTALEAKATTGPWRYEEEFIPQSYKGNAFNQGSCIVADGVEVVCCGHDYDDAGYVGKDDAELIAAMRNHLPALLAAASRLQRIDGLIKREQRKSADKQMSRVELYDELLALLAPDGERETP